MTIDESQHKDELSPERLSVGRMKSKVQHFGDDEGKEEGREGCGEEEDIADEFGDLTFVGPDGWEYHPF